MNEDMNSHARKYTHPAAWMSTHMHTSNTHIYASSITIIYDTSSERWHLVKVSYTLT